MASRPFPNTSLDTSLNVCDDEVCGGLIHSFVHSVSFYGATFPSTSNHSPEGPRVLVCGGATGGSWLRGIWAGEHFGKVRLEKGSGARGPRGEAHHGDGHQPRAKSWASISSPDGKPLRFLSAKKQRHGRWRPWPGATRPVSAPAGADTAPRALPRPHTLSQQLSRGAAGPVRDEVPRVDAPSLAAEPRRGRRREAPSGAGSVRPRLGAEEAGGDTLGETARRPPGGRGGAGRRVSGHVVPTLDALL